MEIPKWHVNISHSSSKKIFPYFLRLIHNGYMKQMIKNPKMKIILSHSSLKKVF